MNQTKTITRELIEEHQRLIWKGVQEGIRVEVERRRREGLPIIVQRNGEIVEGNRTESAARIAGSSR